MIVYLWEKSKKQWRKGLILLGIVLIELYSSLIWSKMLRREVSTLQILPALATFPAPVESISAPKPSDSQNEGKAFVASKQGKYYYPSNCSKARTLSIKNMLYYKDKMTAEAAGYKPYLGCK
jgi:hypothetical protein